MVYSRSFTCFTPSKPLPYCKRNHMCLFLPDKTEMCWNCETNQCWCPAKQGMVHWWIHCIGALMVKGFPFYRLQHFFSNDYFSFPLGKSVGEFQTTKTWHMCFPELVSDWTAALIKPLWSPSCLKILRLQHGRFIGFQALTLWVDGLQKGVPNLFQLHLVPRCLWIVYCFGAYQ